MCILVDDGSMKISDMEEVLCETNQNEKMEVMDPELDNSTSIDSESINNDTDYCTEIKFDPLFSETPTQGFVSNT